MALAAVVQFVINSTLGKKASFVRSFYVADDIWRFA